MSEHTPLYENAQKERKTIKWRLLTQLIRKEQVLDL